MISCVLEGADSGGGQSHHVANDVGFLTLGPKLIGGFRGGEGTRPPLISADLCIFH